ncbi:hypothetical protein Fmac_025154 [Flemingia macrophylla]|uniref:Uncharacterized protein n=1 Tax=Flemingia macrophylla TaxID=520843 RepID=A0ABD1LRF2_9FABA
MDENYELGIYMRMKDYYERMVVLMSDRNQLAVGLDNSSVLSLNHSGVLKIESQHMKPIIIYSPPQPINNTMATLLNTGNFVLQQFHPNGTQSLLWQSFDYPYETLIPTMKLGVNHKTGHHWLVRSRLTSSDDALGAFSLEWEPMEQELTIRRREKVCWRSGKLRNNRFEHILEDAQRTLKYIIVSNGDEDSFSFTTNEEDKYWWLTYNGKLSDDKGGDVARADLCFGYNNTDGGCQRWMDTPKCRNPGDVFLEMRGYFNWENMTTYEMNTSYGHSDCEAICWSDCNCTAFEAYDSDKETGCIFHSTLNYTSDIIEGQILYTLVNTTRNNSMPTRMSQLPEKRKKRMVMKMPYSTNSSGSSATEDFGDDLKKGHNLKVFNYSSIMAITNMFSSENKLGQGGFGPVYKAWELWKDGLYMQLVDQSLNESFDAEEVKRCIHIGLLCVEHYANDRPTMSDIVSMLTNKSAIVSLPQRPAFYVQRDIIDKKFSSQELCTASIEEITTSWEI